MSIHELLTAQHRAHFLLQKWSAMIKEASPISQWTTDSEIAWLAEAASNRSVIAEVGSYKGKSAKALSAGKPTVLYCCDRFQDETQPDFERNLAAEIAAEKLILLPVESEEGASILAEEKVELDMVFIDASHLHADVLRDLQLWTPLVKTGGLVCGHDAYPKDRDNGIISALNEFHPGFNICMDSIWAYIK